MADERYKWKRFWCPRGSIISLGDGGYLLDPDSEMGRIFNEDLVTLDQLSDVPCLVLLGEPGIGKSTVLEEEYLLCKNRIQDRSDESYRLDLRSFGNENRLISKLFDTAVLSQWLEGKHTLRLFLDSFDECALRLDNLTTLLIDEFKEREIPFERLYLRIACRTAVWPIMLEENFRQFWGEEAVQVHEMAPLRREDVATAAKANGIASGTFLSEVERREAIPFAIKPITLGLLIKLFVGPEAFPSTTFELYRRGVRKLCEDPSKSRQSAGLTGLLSADQRLGVAQRIAAVTMLCARSAVWKGGDDGELRDTDVGMWDLIGGVQTVKDSQFHVTEATLQETLGTGLFTERGPNRMGWSHQTYAEFLAARYLYEHEFDLIQLHRVLFNRSHDELKVVPQLQGTTAWLASKRSDVFHELVNRDPGVLLASDISNATDTDREALVKALLESFARENIRDLGWGERISYRKLNHKGLCGQLREYVMDRKKGYLVRSEAITIAIHCGAKGLAADLVNIALDATEDIGVREFAACAAVNLGNEHEKSLLKPLAVPGVEEDGLDVLKGYALQAIWPNHISVEEMLGALSKPKKENLVGSYGTFLLRFPTELGLDDLVPALNWISNQPTIGEMPSDFQPLILKILNVAWENLDHPGVLEAFSYCILRRLRLDDNLLPYHADSHEWISILSEDHKRRRLLGTLLHQITEAEDDAIRLTDPQTPVVLSRDLTWLIEMLNNTTSEGMKQALVKLVKHTFRRNDREHVETVLTAIEAHGVLADEFAWLWKPIEIGSPEAGDLQRKYQRKIERNAARYKGEATPDQLWTRMMSTLKHCEEGDYQDFVALTAQMALHPFKNVTMNAGESDLKSLPGWKKSDEATRQRIVAAAKAYLVDHEPNPEEWLETYSISYGDFCSYLALRLLISEDLDFLNRTPSDKWKRWAPLVIHAPAPFGDGTEALSVHLAFLAYQFAPDEVIDALMKLIDREDGEYHEVRSLWKIGFQWDDCLSTAVLRKLKDGELKIESQACLLKELLDRDALGAVSFAESLVVDAPGSSENARVGKIMGARLLVTHTKNSGWSVVWPAIEHDADFGKELMLWVAWEDNGLDHGVFGRLNEEELARLFVWLVCNFPYEEDPKEEGVHSVSFRENVASWRDSIPSHLRDRATQAGVMALEHIESALPQLEWIKQARFRAKEKLRRIAWVPPQSSELLATALANDERRKFRKQGRLITIQEIDQFSKTVNIPDEAVNDKVLSGIRDLEEKSELEPLIRQIIYDPSETPHGPTELADILTTVTIGREPRLAGFVLKGKSFQKVRNKDVSHQFDKLTTIRALSLGVFCAVGDIHDEAVRNFTNRAQSEGWDWLIIDAQGVARLLLAYSKVCPEDGTPFDPANNLCKHGHVNHSAS